MIRASQRTPSQAIASRPKLLQCTAIKQVKQIGLKSFPLFTKECEKARRRWCWILRAVISLILGTWCPTGRQKGSTAYMDYTSDLGLQLAAGQASPACTTYIVRCTCIQRSKWENRRSSKVGWGCSRIKEEEGSRRGGAAHHVLHMWRGCRLLLLRGVTKQLLHWDRTMAPPI